MKSFTYFDNLYSICQSRKSTRDFLDQPVSDKDIEKIMTVARTSPYASNKKNWEILVVKDKLVIEKIADSVRRVADRTAKSIREDFIESFSLYADHFVHFRSAPVLLIPVFRISKSFSYMLTNGDDIASLPFSPAQWERDNYVKSISCVCMLILLAAQSLGLGSCFMTGPLLAEKEIQQIINIKKGKHIGAIIPIGSIAGTAMSDREKKEGNHGY
jgi:nitroreductase